MAKADGCLQGGVILDGVPVPILEIGELKPTLDRARVPSIFSRTATGLTDETTGTPVRVSVLDPDLDTFIPDICLAFQRAALEGLVVGVKIRIGTVFLILVWHTAVVVAIDKRECRARDRMGDRVGGGNRGSRAGCGRNVAGGYDRCRGGGAGDGDRSGDIYGESEGLGSDHGRDGVKHGVGVGECQGVGCYGRRDCHRVDRHRGLGEHIDRDHSGDGFGNNRSGCRCSIDDRSLAEGYGDGNCR